MTKASWLAAVLVGACLALPATAMTPDAALKALAKADVDLATEAAGTLRALPDLLSRHGKGLTALLAKYSKDGTVASRVLDLVRARGAEGCTFIAGLVNARHPAWVEAVVDRFPSLPRCEKLETALSDVLAWAPDPATSPEASMLVSRVLALAWEARLARGGEKACRFVLAGTDAIRQQAIETVVAVRAPGTEGCLVRAYNEATQNGSKSAIRLALLRAVAAFGGVDAVPTLVLALDRPEDRETACELLLGAGREGVNSMVFAVRTGEGRSEGVRNCLMKEGAAAVSGVLPLLDHPSERVRGFALQFLALNRSPDALKVLRDRFLKATGAERGTVLNLLALYPVGDVRDVIDTALTDTEPAMRMQALDAIDAAHGTAFGARLKVMAEDDPVVGIRRRALEVAWHVGDEGIVPTAQRLVDYETVEIRVLAAEALGYLGNEKTVDVLKGYLKDRSETVAAAARDALWRLTYADPAKGKGRYRTAPKAGELAKGRDFDCDGAPVTVLGKKGPLVVVLPGGPAVDLTWARPWLDDLAEDALVAFVGSPAVAGSDARAAAGLPGPATLACVLKNVERERAVLVSHGLGGVNALRLARETPAAVAGVATLSSALPDQLQAFDDATIAAIPEPYKTLASGLAAKQARFAPAALNRYLARVMAPVYGGEEEPWRALAVAVDVARTARAFSFLSRPEAPSQGSETHRFLFVVPREVSGEWVAGYEKFAPGRTQVERLEGCGFLPQVGCSAKTLRLLARFAAEAGK